MPSRTLPFGSDTQVIPVYFAKGSGHDDPGFQRWKREHPDCFAAGHWSPARQPRQAKPPAPDDSSKNGARRLSPAEIAELASVGAGTLDPSTLSLSDFQSVAREARVKATSGSSSGDTATEDSVPDPTPIPKSDIQPEGSAPSGGKPGAETIAAGHQLSLDEQVLNGSSSGDAPLDTFAQNGSQISDGSSPSQSPNLPNQDLSLSGDGLDRLYHREAQPGVTDHTHWPGGGSGVTIGPGYDMGARTADQVRSDLQAIGVDEQAAATLSVGAGLRGAQAQNFAQVHASDVSLTEQQQHELLNLADQNAQQAVRTNVHVPLNQNQYDALVSFAYNVGPGAFNNSTLLRLLNNGDYNGAAGQFERWSRSNGEIVEGFVSRRAAELRQFQSP